MRLNRCWCDCSQVGVQQDLENPHLLQITIENIIISTFVTAE